MKRTILYIFCFTLFCAFVSSCNADDSMNNDDDRVNLFPEEKFLDEYLRTTLFDQEVVVTVNGRDNEIGLEFTPTVKGQINAIVVQLPDVNNNLKVTIWESDTKRVLRTASVNVAAADTEFIFDIDKLELVKGKKYSISMNSNDWYRRTRSDNGDVTYPITIGNIDINSYGYTPGSEPRYIDRFRTAYYAGNLAFRFQQTE